MTKKPSRPPNSPNRGVSPGSGQPHPPKLTPLIPERAAPPPERKK